MSMVFIICGSLMGLLQLGPVAWLIEKKGEKFYCLWFSIPGHWHIHAYYLAANGMDFNLCFFHLNRNGDPHTKPGFSHYKGFGKRIWSITRHL